MAEKPESGITVSDLLKEEISSKKDALRRYDEIIWRIRTGYIVILYGALGLLTGKGQKLERLALPALLLISGFSILAYCLDITFRLRQLRVVGATNDLTDLALEFASGEGVEAAKIRELLHIAGESTRRLDRRTWVKAAFLILLYYAVTPLFASLLFVQSTAPVK